MYVCDHEVTQAEYEQFMPYSNSLKPNDNNGKGNNFPAYYVKWVETIAYCNLRSTAEGLNPAYYIIKNGQRDINITSNSIIIYVFWIK